MPKISFYSGVLKKLKEDSRNTLTKKFKNELQDLKNILNQRTIIIKTNKEIIIKK